MLWRVLFAALALCLAACAPNADEEAAARLTYDQVASGQLDALEPRLHATLVKPDTRTTLEQLHSYIPSGAPQKVERLSWTRTSIAGGDTTSTYQHRYDYADRVVIARTVLVTPPTGAMRVAGFHINVLDRSEVDANEFSLEGKPAYQMAFFAMVWISLALMVIAFFGTLFTKGARPKWLLAIITWVGAPVFLMNWNTGAWETKISIGLVNFGITRGASPLDPWLMTFHIPIGALIVLSLLFPLWMRRT